MARKKNKKKSYLIVTNRNQGIIGKMSLFTLFFFFIMSSVSATSLSENLGFFDSIQYKVSHFQNPLTLQGQESSCSVNPEVTIRNLQGENKKVYFMDLLSNSQKKKLSKKGKINVYYNLRGTETFKEFDYGASSYIGSSFSFALEFYNCPDKQKQVISKFECETADNKELGDIICKGGSYLAAIDFDISEGTCKVRYDKVKSCKYGCDFSTCNDEKGEILANPDIDTVDSDGNKVDDWSDGFIADEYKKISQQLEGKITEIETLNKLLDKQKKEMLSEKEKAELEELQKKYSDLDEEARNKVKESLKKDKTNLDEFYGDNSFIFIVLGGLCTLGTVTKLRGMW